MKLCNDCAHLGRQRIYISSCRNPSSERFEDTFAYDETRDACQLYQSKAGGPTGLKFIESYRNRYPGSEFWIIGCDPNLDLYPDDFFDSKLSIAIGIATIAFPDCTYFFLKSEAFISAIRFAGSRFLKKCFIVLSKTGRGWEQFGTDPIYMRLKMGKRVDQYTLDDWRLMADQIFGNGPCEFLSRRTSASFAIEAAAVLGAKRIVLVGCSGMPLGSQGHAWGRGMWAFYPERCRYLDELFALSNPRAVAKGSTQSLSLNPIRQDISLLTHLLGAHGVEVVSHRFDEKKNEFVFEEIEVKESPR